MAANSAPADLGSLRIPRSPSPVSSTPGRSFCLSLAVIGGTTGIEYLAGAGGFSAATAAADRLAIGPYTSAAETVPDVLPTRRLAAEPRAEASGPQHSATSATS
ncbi:MAG: hypothetical protein U0232_31175 [Thermomicrobiales bacterium]